LKTLQIIFPALNFHLQKVIAMEWLRANNQLLHMQEFHLANKGTDIAVLKYSTIHHSVRISIDQGHHRLFYIERTKQPFSKAILKDQYGMTAGTVSLDKINDNSGSFELDGKKYFYRVEKKEQRWLHVYEISPLKPLYSCKLPDNADSNTLIFLAPAFCWCCSFAVRNHVVNAA
jgi:hypothetical protein